MKIAISTDGDNVSSHFGRCPEYTIVDIENNKVASREVIANPGHEPGFLPQFLKEKSVNIIIAGGMGPRAQELFRDANIDTILGIEGSINDTIDAFISGNLKSKGSSCSEGAGKGYGIDKSVCDHSNH